ncbi:TetR/AcrR family transcriptional regulator [Pandoraea norimbergensis]|uniref:TetR family transcriptional regulator n=1 Tax=Pandoraea norimbergensis TaxID=93219 RepID=A0ABM5WQK0_9BURK|nr:helix-turn-helix domain-containing protein [Pandoraea norimbergensis]ALS62884.1 TetR family transcriptional regulator [Pandoraea norimbergensis]
MPKPTKAEINADIIERAAGLFARHGFEQTSLQQIADAVNYSKAGLLHHFPSKLAIYEAAVGVVRNHMIELRERVKGIPVGIERDRALVDDAVQFTYDWPGVSAFSNRISDNAPDGDPALIEIGMILYDALGIDLTKLDLERIVRVTSAFAGLGATALQAVRADQKREWRPIITQAAMEALGHGKR